MIFLIETSSLIIYYLMLTGTSNFVISEFLKKLNETVMDELNFLLLNLELQFTSHQKC